MKIVSRISELDHPTELSTGLVPTMGAFHEGHLRLMQTARQENERVVVSLFVNPTQFGQGEDFERYPRDLDGDFELAEKAGADVLFAPSTEEIYPRVGCTISVPEVADLWEGKVRPTHFAGVATVVCKLFNIVRCDVAYFGQKDLQQCLVIQRMIEDLNIPVKFSRQPTVRESDGLAMSSRNAYLSEHDRCLAPSLYKQLSELRRILDETRTKVSEIELLLGESLASLESLGFRVDYLELIDLASAKPTRDTSGPCALIVAARLGNTRLIDNVIL